MPKLYVAIMVEQEVSDQFKQERDKQHLTSTEYLKQLMDNDNE